MITAQCDLYAAVNTPFNLYAAVNTPFFLSRFSSHSFSLYSSFHFTYWFQSLFERESEQSIWSQFRDTYTTFYCSLLTLLNSVTPTPQRLRLFFQPLHRSGYAICLSPLSLLLITSLYLLPLVAFYCSLLTLLNSVTPTHFIYCRWSLFTVLIECVLCRWSLFTVLYLLYSSLHLLLSFFTYFTHHFTCFCLQVDSNNNSLIERAELRAAVARRLGKDPSDQLLDAMVAALHDNIFLYFSFSSWHVKIIIKSKKQNRTKSVAIECGHHGVEKII